MSAVGTKTPHYVCPSCKKQKVTLRRRPHGEDHYHCGNCQWFAFTESDSPLDDRSLRELRKVNPSMSEAA